MYLYYDRNKVLREVINDEATVATNSSSKIYIYFERQGDEEANDCTVAFRLPDGEFITSLPSDVTNETTQIPYNKDRDLKFFRYGINYHFSVVNLGTENLIRVLNDSGVVAGTPIMSIASVAYTLELFTFMVEDSAVQPEESITASQFAYLVSLFEKKNVIAVVNIGDAPYSYEDNTLIFELSTKKIWRITNYDKALFFDFNIDQYVVLMDGTQTITGTKTFAVAAYCSEYIRDNANEKILVNKEYVDRKDAEIAQRSDVVDVVGTYANLQSYDTSNLTNNDVVKVLNDSTHESATTYYRWIVSQGSGSWSYVGQDNTYSKEQTDALLADKQKKLIAGANVQIDQNGTISVVGINYGAGYGMLLNGSTFSIDSTVIARQSDIASLVKGISFSVSGDNANITYTLFNNEQRTANIPLASVNSAGLMSSSDINAIAELATKVAVLEGVVHRLLYTEGANPTAQQILQFVNDSGYTNPIKYYGIKVVVSATQHVWIWYENIESFVDIGIETVLPFTNSTEGSIKGSTQLGKIYAESDATGSLNGYDKLNNNIAAQYNPSNSYSVGDLCIYQGDLYQCIAVTGGVFDSNDWQQISVDGAKLNKTSLASKVYATDSNGLQALLNQSKAVANDAVVVRDGSQIKVPLTPASNDDAASKKYVDDGLSLKVAKTDFDKRVNGQTDVNDAIRELDYDEISIIGLTASAVLTLKAPISGTIPTYRAIISNNASSNITVTLPINTKIRCNDSDVTISDNTFIIAPDLTLEVSVYNGGCELINKAKSYINQDATDLANYYDKAESDARYYTKSESNSKYYSVANPSGYQANTIESISLNGTAITITNKNVNLLADLTPTQGSDSLVTSGGVRSAINDVAEIAEKKTKNYVISDAATTGYTNDSFNSVNAIVTLTVSGNKIKDIKGNDVPFSDLKIGDMISIVETDVPDRWVGQIGNGNITFYKFETKIDVSTQVQSGDANPVSGGAVKTYVDTAIDNLPEPMVFKGTLGTGGTITSLPTAASSNEGFTYKVITAGTYASQSAKVGDVFVSNGSAWVLIPAGDDVEDTWRQINVNGTSLLGSGISTGAVNFKSGNNVTITGSGNEITISSTDTDTGATSIEVTGDGNAVSAASYNAATRKITLTKGVTALTSHQEIKTINGNSILGSGNLTLYETATETEVRALFNN